MFMYFTSKPSFTNIMTVTLFLLLSPFLAYTQARENVWVEQHKKDYRNVVKNFYSLLFNEKSSNEQFSEIYWDASLDSAMIKKTRSFFNELTSGLKKDEVLKIIDKAEISDEGLKFSVYVKLVLSETNQIYFELGSDLPSIVDKIWLNDGVLLGSKIRAERPIQKLLLVGTIEDKDGYTNIRKTPSTQSKVVGKIMENEYFFYVPNYISDWWLVSKKDDLKTIIGYVHKSRIIKYGKMSKRLQDQISKERNGD